MPFDAITRAVLEYYTALPPAAEDHWYGPWNTILTTLFPSSQGYMVTPQRRLRPPAGDPESHIPDLVIEVDKLSSTSSTGTGTVTGLTFRTVLIAKIRNSQHWQSGLGIGIETLERQLDRETDAAFAGTAHSKVYWIGTIGPHWRYGERGVDDDAHDATASGSGQNLRPLIDWHHTTHDQASFNDLQVLADLVSALCVFHFYCQPTSQS